MTVEYRGRRHCRILLLLILRTSQWFSNEDCIQRCLNQILLLPTTNTNFPRPFGQHMTSCRPNSHGFHNHYRSTALFLPRPHQARPSSDHLQTAARTHSSASSGCDSRSGCRASCRGRAGQHRRCCGGGARGGRAASCLWSTGLMSRRGCLREEGALLPAKVPTQGSCG